MFRMAAASGDRSADTYEVEGPVVSRHCREGGREPGQKPVRPLLPRTDDGSLPLDVIFRQSA